MPERSPEAPSSEARAGSGVAGLDEVLGGGLPRNRLHLIEGLPGTGKTTFALQFLLHGVAQGETVLYVTLSETIEELRAVARSHGWNIEGVALHELAPTEASLQPDQQYTIFHPSEVELGETTKAVLEEVERSRPTRLVFDSLAELRLLARDQLRYRRQILALKQFFAGRHCTVLLLDGGAAPGEGVESIAHSVIHLDQRSPEYGSERRRLRVAKLRGAAYRGGYHDYVIKTGGITVFPRLVAAEYRQPGVSGSVTCEVDGLDRLVGGGLARGTSALLIGPAGVGKSAIATQYAVAAAGRGERAVIFVFDESRATFVQRSDGLGMGLSSRLADGLVTLRQLDPAQLPPGEFDDLVRQAVEVEGARLIVIDSLNGYLNSMAEERSVIVQLHELLMYLGQRGVLTLLTVAQHGLVGERMASPLDVSYLADTVLLIRYFEAAGELRQAISVVKKRSGWHERAIRELRLGPGVRVGEPVREFQGVLIGAPTYLGTGRSLLTDGDA